MVRIMITSYERAIFHANSYVTKIGTDNRIGYTQDEHTAHHKAIIRKPYNTAFRVLSSEAEIAESITSLW